MRHACRFFYASSACIYPEFKQLNTEVEGGGLKEEDAWPAQVQAVALQRQQFPCGPARVHSIII